MDWKECKELIRQDYVQMVGNPRATKRQAIGWGG